MASSQGLLGPEVEEMLSSASLRALSRVAIHATNELTASAPPPSVPEDIVLNENHLPATYISVEA